MAGMVGRPVNWMSRPSETEAVRSPEVAKWLIDPSCRWRRGRRTSQRACVHRGGSARTAHARSRTSRAPMEPDETQLLQRDGREATRPDQTGRDEGTTRALRGGVRLSLSLPLASHAHPYPCPCPLEPTRVAPRPTARARRHLPSLNGRCDATLPPPGRLSHACREGKGRVATCMAGMPLGSSLAPLREDGDGGGNGGTVPCSVASGPYPATSLHAQWWPQRPWLAPSHFKNAIRLEGAHLYVRLPK